MGPRLGHQQSTQRFSVRVFAAHSNHHSTWCNRLLCVSSSCLVMKAAPRVSCDLCSPICLFKSHVHAIRKLVKEFAPSAIYPHIFRENRSQTKIGHGVAVTRNNSVYSPIQKYCLANVGTNFPATRSALLQRLTLHHQGEKVMELVCPFQRYMHVTMEQKELESTCATSLSHTWAIQLLNLQLSSHPQQQ